NFAHTLVTPAILLAIAFFAAEPQLFPFVLIWTAHIGIDRLFGFGLKYPTHFKDTHHTSSDSRGLASRLAGKYWLNIDHRRPINHLNRADSYLFLFDFPHCHSMKPQRIWPVRGSRGKYSSQFSLRVRPRMDFQNV